MVVPGLKTTSSSAVSSRTNPNSRSSETRDPMRRSFTGNPFSKPSINTSVRGLTPNTPANTPSDTPRRNSMSRENIVISFREVEGKENSKDPDQNAAKLRSPATTNGTKHFMSPTISAASKFSASPKKKILVERNGATRTSFSLSEAKNPPMEATDQQPDREALIQKESGASFDSPVTDENFKKAMKRVTFADIKLPLVCENQLESSMEAITDEADLVNFDLSFKISPEPLCASLAPLGADPQMPPYDPKNNYLSPRPQFLHYKPNPRIELFLGGKEAKQLEESFVLESSSDTEVTEETYSENSEKGHPENISSNDSLEEEEENKTELEPIGTSRVPRGAVEAKGVSKPRFFTRSKFVAFLLFMAVAGFVFSGTDSSVKYTSMLKDLAFSMLHNPPEIAKIAKSNIDGLARYDLRLWSAKSYISELVLTFRGMHRESPWQFSNLTGLVEDHLLDWCELFDHKGLEIEGKNEPLEVIPKIEEEAPENLMLEEEFEEDCEVQEDQGKDIQDNPEIEDLDSEDEESYKVQAEKDIAPKLEEVNITAQIAVNQGKDIQDNLEIEDLDSENEESYEVQAEKEKAPKLEEVNITAQIGKQDSLDNVLAEDIELKFEVANTTAKVALIEQCVSAKEQTEERVETPASETSSMDLEAQVSHHVTPSEVDAIRLGDGHGNSETDVWMETPQTSEKVHLTNMLRYKFLSFDSLGYILLLLSLVTANVIFYRMKKPHGSPNAEIQVGHAPVPNKIVDEDRKSFNADYNLREISSRIWQTETETVGELCSLEMSSCQKSSSHNKKSSLRLNETQSSEKRPTKTYRRESFASSDCSMGSPSYGSFTTYEKIPSKIGDGEEEIVTPVRRSSRLRKQVTSP